MPASPRATPPAAPPPPPSLPAPSYPAIESFVESATHEQVESLFAPVRQELGALKGPRAEQARKVESALARTEELLGLLLQTRERLESEAKGSKGRR